MMGRRVVPGSGTSERPAMMREGRFPANEIISLLDVNRRLNLAESTAQDLFFHELVELIGFDNLRDLRLGYAPSRGVERLRAAIGALCGISPEHVVSTQGTALGLYLLAVELCRPGDEAVLFTPCFPPTRGAFGGSGATVREVRVSFDSGYRVVLDDLQRAVGPATKLVSLATPQNPSGVAITAATVDAILEILNDLAPDAYLLVDETYREATYGTRSTPPSLAGRHPKLVVGASISKAYGAPGLRVGWLATADAELRSRLVTAKMNVVISGSTLDETLAACLLERRDQVLGPRRRFLAEALHIVSGWVDRNERRVDWVRPDGGALCCMRLRTSVFDRAAVARFWRLLPQYDLQLAAGAWFGESERTFRLGFGYLPLAELAAALSAMQDAMADALLPRT